MHVAHRYACFIRCGQLRPRYAHRNQTSGCQTQNRKKLFHELSSSLNVVNQDGCLNRISVLTLVGNRNYTPNGFVLGLVFQCHPITGLSSLVLRSRRSMRACPAALAQSNNPALDLGDLLWYLALTSNLRAEAL